MKIRGFLLLVLLFSLTGFALHATNSAWRIASIKTFTLCSSAVQDGGVLPAEFTGDGASATLPLAWNNAPAGTQSYAVIMHHLDPEGRVKWYWILYNIPVTVTALPKNVQGVGVLGTNSVNGRTEYAPPHSKGPGVKKYTYTVYALSAPVELAVPPTQVTREVLLAAMQGHLLGSAELSVVYTRPASAFRNDGQPRM